MAHDHNHDHEQAQPELITLVDEQGNENLFEILLTIDGKEEFGKNYVLLVPVKSKLTHLLKMKTAQKANWNQFQKTLMQSGI